MGVSDSLRCLTSIVNQLEADGLEVTTVETEASENGLTGGVSLEVQFFPEKFRSDDVSLTVDEVTVRDDGTAQFDVSVCLTGQEGAGTPAAGPPAYKDPERLREVYDAYETFPAMTEALGVDVTPKTVRNHMVKHGIHDPGSNTSSDANGAEPDTESDRETATDAAATDVDDSQDDDAAYAGNDPNTNGDGELVENRLLSDGHGLPEDLRLADVKTAVQTAATLTEFRRELGIESEQARQLLQNLNLTDLVYGRVATGPNRDVSMGDIETRILSATANTS